MNKFILPSAIAFALCTSSCSGIMEMKQIDMNQVNDIQDSVLHGQIVPDTKSVHVLQDDDYSKVSIIIRNPALYANKDNLQQAAVRMGVMLVHVLGKDMSVSRATLVITQVDDDQNRIPADGISADMKIDSLKKALLH